MPKYKAKQTVRALRMQAKRVQALAYEARMNVVYAKVDAALSSNECPSCGNGVQRNTALAGWVMCEFYGTTCSWQGFLREAKLLK